MAGGRFERGGLMARVNPRIRCCVWAGVALTGMALGMLGAALIGIAAISLTRENVQADQQQVSWLARKIEDSREVQRALARPLPAVATLTPVTARIRHGSASLRGRPGIRAPQARTRHWDHARDAFAKALPAHPSISASAYQQTSGYIY